MWKAILDFLAKLLPPAKKPAPTPTPVPAPAPSPPPPAKPAPVSPPIESTVEPVEPFSAPEVIRLLNVERGAGKMLPLLEIKKLDELARRWADYNAATGVLDHGDLAKRIASVYPNAPGGEDIAEGQVSAAQVVADWMASPGHRAQILNPAYRYVGIGRATGRAGETFWCADFAG